VVRTIHTIRRYRTHAIETTGPERYINHKTASIVLYSAVAAASEPPVENSTVRLQPILLKNSALHCEIFGSEMTASAIDHGAAGAVTGIGWRTGALPLSYTEVPAPAHQFGSTKASAFQNAFP